MCNNSIDESKSEFNKEVIDSLNNSWMSTVTRVAVVKGNIKRADQNMLAYQNAKEQAMQLSRKNKSGEFNQFATQTSDGTATR